MTQSRLSTIVVPVHLSRGFLASALAKVDPALVHNLHMVQSVLALPDHLAVCGARRRKRESLSALTIGDFEQQWLQFMHFRSSPRVFQKHISVSHSVHPGQAFEPQLPFLRVALIKAMYKMFRM